MDARLQELISAYFDGEVTSAERQEVEQLLADNREARAWLDELAALRGDIHALPPQRLEGDFADGVLQQIAQKAERTSAGPVPPPPTARPAGEGERTNDKGFRRGWLWSALAIAVAVAIMIYSGRPGEVSVARKDTPEPPRAVPEEGAGDQRVGGRQEPLVDEPLELEMAATPDPQEARAKRKGVDSGGLTRELGDLEKKQALQDRGNLDRDLAFKATEAEPRPATRAPALAPALDRVVEEQRSARRKNEAAQVRRAPAPAAQSWSDSDGVVLFRFRSPTSPAAVDAYVRSRLETRPPPARQREWRPMRLQRQGGSSLADTRSVPEVAESAAAGQIVFQIEGTGGQIAATLARLQDQPATVQLVRADRRLDDLLASLSRPAKEDSRDQLAQRKPAASGSFLPPAEELAADDDKFAARSFAARSTTERPAQIGGLKPAAAAKGPAASPSRRDGQQVAGAERVGAADALAEDLGERETEEASGVLAKDQPAADEAVEGKLAAGRRALGVAADAPVEDAPADVAAAQERQKKRDRLGNEGQQELLDTRFKVLLVFQLDPTSWSENGTDAAARQGIDDERPAEAEPEAEPGE